ncbi:MAG: S9 family peptidase, partial [Chloroflexota bacterium]|nr:S9 family peptidase [Chloroflexota bacterium]
MAEIQVAPYGSWKSPITAERIAAGSLRLTEMRFDQEEIYWAESRPWEGGRYVVVRWTPDGVISDITPPPFNARTGVHEYGGGAFLVSDGTVYFSNFEDGRIYRQLRGSEPEPLTPEAALRYADFLLDGHRNRLICVREDHRPRGREAINTLIALPLDRESEGQVLVEGNDFFASPRLSPDGTRLAWLTWNHPNMPWDGTELWLAKIAGDGTLVDSQQVAGGISESIFQPEWSPDGTLYFISDRIGWWNLYRWQNGKIERLHERAAEFGQPQWVFGQSTYGFSSNGTIVSAYKEEGISYLAALDTTTGELTPLDTPYTIIHEVRVAPGRVLLRAGSPTEPLSIVLLDLKNGERRVLRCSQEIEMDSGYLSIPRSVEFPTENNLTAYA